MAQKSDKNDDALAGLDALILQARKRLAPNPDYIVLQALEKARAGIAPAAHKATPGDDEIIDDTTGRVFRFHSSGKPPPHQGKPSPAPRAGVCSIPPGGAASDLCSGRAGSRPRC